MRIWLLEPFLAGSHKQWAEGYQRHSRHEVDILSLEGKFWKWRMHGGAISLAQTVKKRLAEGRARPDLLLATDMLDVATFAGLCRDELADLPLLLYMHENQLTYPWSPTDQDPGLQRDRHYAFINYSSALAAKGVYFNSRFHRQAFLQALPAFLQAFPDHREMSLVEHIRQKSHYLPLGLDLQILEAARPVAPKAHEAPVLVWNHRWEYDKGPTTLFEALFQLQQEGIPFHLVVLGERYAKAPPIFEEARQRLADRILHWGYVPDRAEYARWLWRADLLPVSSRHDFFGLSVVEAMACGCLPVLPHRLAYPEHVPEALHADLLYEEEEALVKTLRKLLRQPMKVEHQRACQQHVKAYDWRNLARVYDDCFAEWRESTPGGP